MLLTPRTTTAAEAAKAIRFCVEVGAVSLLAHALEAMADEGVDEAEVVASSAASRAPTAATPTAGPRKPRDGLRDRRVGG